ncbi:MAG: hypothetical protein M1824_006099 [Vezdaea acicularis]|nr:MAG: hypothetical protein M1824_006099 [Vezdaea acicularis]
MPPRTPRILFAWRMPSLPLQCRQFTSHPSLLDSSNASKTYTPSFISPDSIPSEKPQLDAAQTITRWRSMAAEKRTPVSARQSLGSSESHARAIQQQMTRRWQVGDVYAPKDLGIKEMKRWKMRRPPTKDAVDILGVKPLLEYKNFAMMSEMVSETGRIKHSRETGLRPKNQRKMAKAVRRAIGLGLMPSVHRHPEILELHSQMYGGNEGRFI